MSSSNRHLRCLLWLCLTGLAGLLALAGCSGSHSDGPIAGPPHALHKPLQDFAPAVGASFNVRVRDYDRWQGEGTSKSEDVGVLPEERAAIEALESLGYAYAPSGPARYLVEAHLLCYDPKAMALDAEGAGLGGGPSFDVDPFDWPGFGPVFGVQESYAWSPQIQHTEDEANSCAGTLTLGIIDTAQQPVMVYGGHVQGGKAAYADNCPYVQCQDGLTNDLVTELKSVFAKK